MALLEININGRNKTTKRWRSTKPQYKNRQFDFAPLRNDQAKLDYEAYRVAYTFATGRIPKEEIEKLLDFNKKGKPYSLPVDDQLYNEGVVIELVFAKGDCLADEKVEILPYKAYCHEEKEKRDEYKYPIICVYTEESDDAIAVINGAQKEDAEKAKKFSDTYIALMENFSNLPSIMGSKKFVLGDMSAFLPKDNRMPRVVIGVSEKKGGFLDVAMNLTHDRLAEMESAKRLLLIQNVLQVADAIKDEGIKAMKAFYGEKATTSGKPKDNAPTATKLYRLVKRSEGWKDLGMKTKLDAAIEKHRADGIEDDDDIFNIFVITGQFKADIAAIEQEIKEKAAKKSSDGQSQNNGNQSKSKPGSNGKKPKNPGNQKKPGTPNYLVTLETRSVDEWDGYFNNEQVTAAIGAGYFERFHDTPINIRVFRSVFKKNGLAMPECLKKEYQAAVAAEDKAQRAAQKNGGDK